MKPYWLALLLLVPVAYSQVSLDFSPPPKVESIVLKMGTMSGQEVVNCDALVSNGAWPSYSWKINGKEVEGNEQIYATEGLSADALVACEVTANNENGRNSETAERKLSDIRGFASPLTGYVIKNIQDEKGGINWQPILLASLICVTLLNGLVYFRGRKKG